MESKPLEGELITADEIAAAEEAGASKTELLQIFNLKEQAARFATAFSNLLSWGDSVEGTELEAEYNKLVERGFGLRDKIDKLMGQIDAAWSWLKGLTKYIPGLGNIGRGGVGTLVPYESGTLGLAWFIPVAAIGAVLAVVGYWMADYAKFARKFAEQQRIARELEADGVSPVEANRQAAASVAGTVPGLFGGGGPVPWLLIAAAIGGGVWLYQRKRG